MTFYIAQLSKWDMSVTLKVGPSSWQPDSLQAALQVQRQCQKGR